MTIVQIAYHRIDRSAGGIPEGAPLPGTEAQP